MLWNEVIGYEEAALCLGGMAACGPQGQTHQEEDVDGNGQDYFNGNILEISDTYILVECLELTSGAVSSGTLAKVSTDVVTAVGIPELSVGDKVRVVFYGVKETDPVSFQTVFAIYRLDDGGETLPIEQKNSPEADVDINKGMDIECEGFPNWGLTLSVENISSTGLTLVVTQSGGEPTASLETGDPYRLITLVDGAWKVVEELPLPEGVDARAWNDIAYNIPMEESVEFEVNWEWIYGELPARTYRFIKEFMDFRKTADYDTFEYWVEFEVE